MSYLTATDWFGLAVLLISGLVIAILSATVRCLWVLTHPPRRGYAFAVSRSVPGTPDEVPPVMGGPFQFREWTHRTAGLELAVWEIPGAAPAGPIAIISHGWGDSRVHSLQRVAALMPWTSRVLLYDLRGHGESSGTCTLGTREVDDLLSLIAAVAGPTDRILLFGHSLGAGIAIAAGSQDPRVCAVIAEAPYRFPQSPARAVLTQSGQPHGIPLRLALGVLGVRLGQGFAWFGNGGVEGSVGAASELAFDRRALASKLTCPLLVLYAAADAICTLDDAKAIAGANPHAQLVEIPNAGHTDLWTLEPSRAQATQAVGRFIEGLSSSHNVR